MPNEHKMTQIEKVALSLEFLDAKRLLLEGPGGPSDCIFALFSRDLPEAEKLWGRAARW